jgi:two-component system response regulator NreC
VAATPIDVVLADDHAMVRAGLRLLLEESSAIRVVGEASNVPAMFDLVGAHRPAVAILELNMPGGSMLDAIPALRDAAPEVAIVVITAESDPVIAREALAAGERAYLLKDSRTPSSLRPSPPWRPGARTRRRKPGAELAALPPDGDPLATGSSFAGHRIDGLAGRGGMAVVYRATDLALDPPSR